MSGKSNDGWSMKDSKALEQWLAAGLPPADIARRLGRSASSIDSKASRLGINPPEACRWTRKHEQQLTRFWKMGVPTKTIADHLARRPGAILSKARSLGLRRPAKPRRHSGKPTIRSCRSCGIRLPTAIPCHRTNCMPVAVGQAPQGSEFRTKFSLVSSSMADG